MAAADTSAPKVDPSFNPAELQQALDGAVPRSGDVTAKLQPETRVAAEPTYTLDPMLSRLETQAMRSKSAMVMNDALFGMINDGEVNLGERSQGHISDMQGMAEKIAPRIEAQPILNLDQIHQDAKTVGVDLHASDANGKITVSKIVTNESQRGLGLGTKVMNDLIAFADANGKDIALTPSKDFGGSVPRLKKFYERLGFVENKGKAKDFSTRETMIRPAQKIEAKPIEQAKTEAISTKKSFTVPSPEPQLPELKAAYAALDAAPKAAIEPNAIEAKAIQEAKAEGFDPVANTNDHELDIVALRDQGLLTKEDEAMLKAADETHAAVGAWEDVMNVARECFLK
jgi:GNAT superfamily N-acetyltransferase